MNVGETANAVRRALNVLDDWNDVTGAVTKNSGIYWELQAVIEDAVHCGIQAALGICEKLPGDEK